MLNFVAERITMEGDILGNIREIIKEEQLLFDEPMSSHTTFRVGGPADVIVKPGSISEIEQVLQWCSEHAIPYYIVGNGSNLLVGDAGIRGVVIQIGNAFSEIEVGEDDTIWVQAGCMLGKVANAALEHSLTGLEFASGIPGTIGGAVLMNAGAYGGEMKDIIECVTLLTPAGEVLILPQDQMEFGYRDSIAARKNYIVLEVKLRLQKGNPKEIAGKMKELNEARKEKQPLEFPSAGSTFKRPEGYFAGKLIMDAGLAGYRVGDAQVSEKHCGFVINRGHATAKDIVTLMNEVVKQVEEKYQVILEPEIRKIGDFS
ncbi:MAG: UDP-N-acetylmuramate dehydrogenase [Bacteroides sp.]|nr:UDP-N-acetylmuramate dehydrogenase [Bacteroides sp.]MCM1548357.1 UDP-N-acetylmuramate dehydrogenase [Clostridium sp.]